MEAYRPLLLNAAHLVALWAVTYISASLTPNSTLEYVVLALASLWLLYGLYLMQKARRRPTSLFLGAAALMPWAFYLELYYINNHSAGISPEIFEANMQHAIFIYQSFKYVFLTCAFIAVFKGLWCDIRDFGTPLH